MRSSTRRGTLTKVQNAAWPVAANLTKVQNAVWPGAAMRIICDLTIASSLVLAILGLSQELELLAVWLQEEVLNITSLWIHASQLSFQLLRNGILGCAEMWEGCSESIESVRGLITAFMN